MTLPPPARRILARMRAFLDEQAELSDREWLINHPWEEEFLHWSYDGQRWRLHGHRLPPPGGRRRGITRTGWCLGATRPPAGQGLASAG